MTENHLDVQHQHHGHIGTLNSNNSHRDHLHQNDAPQENFIRRQGRNQSQNIGLIDSVVGRTGATTRTARILNLFERTRNGYVALAGWEDEFREFSRQPSRSHVDQHEENEDFGAEVEQKEDDYINRLNKEQPSQNSSAPDSTGSNASNTTATSTSVAAASVSAHRAASPSVSHDDMDRLSATPATSAGHESRAQNNHAEATATATTVFHQDVVPQSSLPSADDLVDAATSGCQRSATTSNSTPQEHVTFLTYRHDQHSTDDSRRVRIPLNQRLVVTIPRGEFALKSINAASTTRDNTVESVHQEVAIMRRLCSQQNPEKRCPFIVDFYFAARDTPSNFLIGMEPCEGGDLFSLMHTQDHISVSDITFFISEIAMGLQFLHDRNVLHADIKPENIGLTATGHVRLLDFGLSRVLHPQFDLNTENGHLEVQTCSGTLAYAAPEVLMRHKHGFESDWWSLGVVLYEMFFGCWPWEGETRQHTCDLICASPLTIPQGEDSSWAQSEVFDLASRLLVKDPTHRLGWTSGLREIKEHTLFSVVDWNRLGRQEYLAPFIVS